MPLATKVLDLSRILAGPLCTMMLGDLGARVIKVERPGTGDDTRAWGPPFDDRGESAYFLSTNRNKKSIAIDFDLAPDRDLLLELIAGADVVVDNFLPGTLERRGVYPDQLLSAHASLVWCTITGFGRDSDRAGYDLVVQAESGWMSITGDPSGAPMRAGVAFADIIAGKDAAIAILAALLAGRSSSSGEAPDTAARRIYISLAASARAALANVGQNSLVTGIDAARWGNQHPNLVPYQLFETADRPIVIGVGTDAQWKACAIALGLDGAADDPLLATNAGRLAARQRVVRAMQSRLIERPAHEWIERLGLAKVPSGIVNSVLEALNGCGASPLNGIAPSVPGAVRLPPPRLDEHGTAIRQSGWNVFASPE